jgi:hypothetical protein
MHKIGIAVLTAAIAAGCTTATGAPASTESATTTNAASARPTPIETETSTARPRPTISAEPLPDDLIGAWYQAAPAYWWFLRAGSPTCVAVAHTDLDCVTYQLGGRPAFVGAATMDRPVLNIRWTRGYCAGQRTGFRTGFFGDTLRLFDLPDDCGGDDFVLSRAGTGTTPSAPPPPAN